MAISMVRKPSETPNITNIDDIIPFRYAYGNQSGYVISRGAEVSHTVNGNQFTVNSGRLVIQGVESDIDANGITLTIDAVSETRYYTVYHEINLATNTSNIKVEFDTATYPNITEGDDLTANSSGIARLVLYNFIAQNGVISGVEKVVRAINYVKNIEVEKSINTKKINGLEIKKNNENVLAVDNNETIPRRKVLLSTPVTVGNTQIDVLNIDVTNKTLSFLIAGRFYDVKMSIQYVNIHLDTTITASKNRPSDTSYIQFDVRTKRLNIRNSDSKLYCTLNESVLNLLTAPSVGSLTSGEDTITIDAIYEIIE